MQIRLTSDKGYSVEKAYVSKDNINRDVHGKIILSIVSPAPEVDFVVCKGKEILFYNNTKTSWGHLRDSGKSRTGEFVLSADKPEVYEVYAVPYVLSADKMVKKETPFVITLATGTASKVYRGCPKTDLSIVKLGEIKNGQFVMFMMGHSMSPLEWYESMEFSSKI